MEQTFQKPWLFMVITIAIVWFFLVLEGETQPQHTAVQFTWGRGLPTDSAQISLPNKAAATQHLGFTMLFVYLGHLFAVTELCSLYSDFVFDLSSCNIIFWGGVQLF